MWNNPIARILNRIIHFRLQCKVFFDGHSIYLCKSPNPVWLVIRLKVLECVFLTGIMAPHVFKNGATHDQALESESLWPHFQTKIRVDWRVYDMNHPFGPLNHPSLLLVASGNQTWQDFRWNIAHLWFIFLSTFPFEKVHPKSVPWLPRAFHHFSSVLALNTCNMGL